MVSSTALTLRWLDGPRLYAIARLGPEAAVPDWARDARPGIVSVTRTADELSIVAPQDVVPEFTVAERGWIAMRVEGTLEFDLVGVLHRLTRPLAVARISVFAISTYDTDILLVRESEKKRAVEALGAVADVGPLLLTFD